MIEGKVLECLVVKRKGFRVFGGKRKGVNMESRTGLSRSTYKILLLQHPHNIQYIRRAMFGSHMHLGLGLRLQP